MNWVGPLPEQWAEDRPKPWSVFWGLLHPLIPLIFGPAASHPPRSPTGGRPPLPRRVEGRQEYRRAIREPGRQKQPDEAAGYGAAWAATSPAPAAEGPPDPTRSEYREAHIPALGKGRHAAGGDGPATAGHRSAAGYSQPPISSRRRRAHRRQTRAAPNTDGPCTRRQPPAYPSPSPLDPNEPVPHEATPDRRFPACEADTGHPADPQTGAKDVFW